MIGTASFRPGPGAQRTHCRITTDTVYRGEHGRRDCRPVQSRRGSISFVDNVATARIYARWPNDVQLDRFAEDPRVLCARLAVARPFIVQRDDPFVELSTIEEALGRQEAHRIALRFAGAIESTDYWKHAFQGRFAGVGELIAADPDCAAGTYFEAYLLLDDIREVECLKAAGYDGAIYAGSGASAGDVEYRVFSSAQVRFVDVPFDPLDDRADCGVAARTGRAESEFARESRRRTTCRSTGP